MPNYNNYFDDTHALHPYTHSTQFNVGSIAPENAIRGEVPAINPGLCPCEKDGTWIDVENHKDEEGFVNGEAFTIKEYGPYPDGWTAKKPPPTLEEAKTTKLEEITAERDRRNQAGFAYLGTVFDAGTTSVQNFTLAAQAASQAISAGASTRGASTRGPVPFSRVWTVQDDSTITLTAEQIIEIVLEIETRVDALHQQSRLLKEAVREAENLEDVKAISWPRT